MKKILNGPTVWRAKCPVCDCEFEYDSSETLSIFNKNSDYPFFNKNSNYPCFKVVICPSCKSYINHLESVSTATETKMEDTMTT